MDLKSHRSRFGTVGAASMPSDSMQVDPTVSDCDVEQVHVSK